MQRDSKKEDKTCKINIGVHSTLYSGRGRFCLPLPIILGCGAYQPPSLSTLN